MTTAGDFLGAIKRYGADSPSLIYEFDRFIAQIQADAAPSPALTREALAAAFETVVHGARSMRLAHDSTWLNAADAILSAIGTPPPAPTSTREENL